MGTGEPEGQREPGGCRSQRGDPVAGEDQGDDRHLLYHFFPGGKDDLAEAVIGSSGRAYQELFELIGDAAPDVPTAVTDFWLL